VRFKLDAHTFYYLIGFNSVTLPASRQGMLMRELDNGAVLEAIKVPSLIIQGKDDRIVLSASSDNIARRIPHVSRVDYDHCGHVPFVEAAEQFNRAQRPFCSPVLVLPMIDFGKWGEVGTVVLILYKTTGEENGIKSRFEIM